MAWTMCAVFAAGTSAGAETGPAEAALSVLESRCLKCHNPVDRKSGLDLTSRETALEGGEKGPALVPGSAAGSRLYLLVALGDMPQDDPLPDPEAKELAAWINAGAPWERPLQAPARPRADHTWWSLQPLSVSPPPRPEGVPEEWARHSIDLFVFAKLMEKGLEPAQVADRPTLIRRATFDLLGLPPTPEEIQAFVEDESPTAWADLVERLLASPHYGERWGRHWLDVARFGESHGYEQNWLRENAWPYRDYVVDAFNDDKPFDQFVLEQLAADQVAAGDPRREIATAFLVTGPHDKVGIDNIEGERQKRANDLDDIITTTSAGFLGLTVNCARCHDHKFDPILQRDYYRMQAVFAGVQHGGRSLTSAEERRERERIEGPLRDELERLQAQLQELEEAAQPAIEDRRDEILARYRPPVSDRGTEETFPPVLARWVRMTIHQTNRGVPMIEELEVWTEATETAPSRNVALASAGGRATASSTRVAEGDPGLYSIDLAIDGLYGRTWIPGGDKNKTSSGQITLELAALSRISRIYWTKDKEGGFQGLFRRNVPTHYSIETSVDGQDWREVSSTAGRQPFAEDELHDLLLEATLSPERWQERQRLARRIEELAEALEALPPGPPALYVARFEQPEEPSYLLDRGSPMDRVEEMAPASPTTLGDRVPAFQLPVDGPEGERRLALARWITHDANPLTPRVLANRVWHYHFGRGIVGTPSDFGFNGESPTHPELLDWLARRVQLLGWRLKPLHREIMLSRTYRQSSRHDPESATVDAEARFLWRFPPRRLEAEPIRDSILAVSGSLDRRMGGEGFQLYRYTLDNVATYYPLENPGEETYRRSVYHQNARSVKVDILGQYDCPDTALPAPRRESTTSPMQALALLNDTFVVDQARRFSERVKEEVGDSPGAQVERAYFLAFGRPPTTRERGAALELVLDHGLPFLCRALFNANEFIYVM